MECAPVDPYGWTAGVIFIERIYPSTDSQGPTHLTMKSLVIEKTTLYGKIATIQVVVNLQVQHLIPQIILPEAALCQLSQWEFQCGILYVEA